MTGIRAARKLSLSRRTCVVAALMAAVTSTAAALAGCTPGGTEGSSDYVRYRGIILNEQTREGVEGVSVSVDTDPAPSVVFTDDEGAFTLSVPVAFRDQDVRIRVRKEGYEPYDRIINPAGGRSEEIRLKPVLSPTPKPRVTAPERADTSKPPVPPAPVPVPRADPARFVNEGVASSAGRAGPIVDQRLGADIAATSRIAGGFAGSDSLFKPEFVTEGLFSRVHRGDIDVLKPLRIEKVQLLLLGIKSARTRREDVAGVSVVQATVTLDVRLVRPASGFTTAMLPVSASASGFDDDRAIEDASDKALEALLQQLGQL